MEMEELDEVNIAGQAIAFGETLFSYLIQGRISWYKL